jgi:hypothetical protein
MIIREIKESDSSAFLKLNKKLDQESKFMLLEPDERGLTEEQQRSIISGFIQSSNSNIFVAEEDGELVGQITVIGGNAKRIQHRAYIVIGILQDYAGQGIGRK